MPQPVIQGNQEKENGHAEIEEPEEKEHRVGERENEETQKVIFRCDGFHQASEGKRDSGQEDQDEDFFSKECRHDKGEQRDKQVSGPVGNRLGVQHEELLKQFVVMKDKLADDVGITQV